MEKYDKIKAEEMRWEEMYTEDADLIVIAYGTPARVSKTAVEKARSDGLNVGLIRPISLFPFPDAAFAPVAKRGTPLLVVELSGGQMIEDVRLAVNGRCPVHFQNRMGGMVPGPAEVLSRIQSILAGGGDLA